MEFELYSVGTHKSRSKGMNLSHTAVSVWDTHTSLDLFYIKGIMNFQPYSVQLQIHFMDSRSNHSKDMSHKEKHQKNQNNYSTNCCTSCDQTVRIMSERGKGKTPISTTVKLLPGV